MLRWSPCCSQGPTGRRGHWTSRWGQVGLEEHKQAQRRGWVLPEREAAWKTPGKSAVAQLLGLGKLVWLGREWNTARTRSRDNCHQCPGGSVLRAEPGPRAGEADRAGKGSPGRGGGRGVHQPGRHGRPSRPGVAGRAQEAKEPTGAQKEKAGSEGEVRSQEGVKGWPHLSVDSS